MRTTDARQRRVPPDSGGDAPPHSLNVDDVAASLETSPEAGIAEDEARQRRDTWGHNVLDTEPPPTWPTVLVRQFTSPLVVILAVAAVASAVVGDVADAVTIAAIVVANAILGFVQEWRAERAIDALQRMLSPEAHVVRGGRARTVGADEIVPGDVVLLETGQRVPADIRVAEATGLQVDESALTGESQPVTKTSNAVPAETPLAERASMGWMGTTVTAGHATGIVTATGMDTQFGLVAGMAAAVDRAPTPLQHELATLARRLGIFALATSALIAAIGVAGGRAPLEMFLTGVSLAVAIVPEGLPAVVTITLALGIRAMVRKQALLRRLQAAETLGAATVICTDKTGTLTRGEMAVVHVSTRAGDADVTGTGYAPEGRISSAGEPLDPAGKAELLALAQTGLVCNHARIAPGDDGWVALGDPTEAALVTLAAKSGLDIDATNDLVDERPFDGVRKRMSVVERCDGGNLLVHVKGAPEVVVGRCTRVLDRSSERALGAGDEPFLHHHELLAASGLRVLALARRQLSARDADVPDIEADLTLLGFVGLLDPPRPEAAPAVRMAREAGIRVIMITGDAPPTARSVAERVGLGPTRVVHGSDLERMDDGALAAALSGGPDDGVVIARAAPEHKLRIVELLQAGGDVVAMTGDGVNDAPALKRADIGIAMGVRGTDVARGSAAMILTDDNFASIVAAVEEGRRQYDNIRKFVRYLLSSNVGEVVAIVIGIALGWPLVLLPAQILWVNLITDGPVAVALGVERAESGLMERPPRRRDEHILDRAGIAVIAVLGVVVGLATVAVFHTGLAGASVDKARTLAFTGIVLLEQVNVFNFRALRAPLREVGYASNRWMLLAWAGSLLLQVAAVHAPPLQRALHTVPLTVAEWLALAALAVPLFVAVEGLKTYRWRRR